MKPVTLGIAFLLVAIPAPGFASHTNLDVPVQWHFVIDSASGALVYKITNPSGFSFDATAKRNAGTFKESDPFYFSFVFPNGSIKLWEAMGPSYAHYRASGPGVAYVGAGSTTISSGNPTEQNLNDSAGYGNNYAARHFDATEAYLVLAWDGRVSPIEFYTNWSEGTQFEFLGSGTARNYRLDELQGSVRVGFGPAVRAHVSDSVTFDPGAQQVFGSIQFSTTSLWGYGNLTVYHAGQTHEASLTYFPSPDYLLWEDICICTHDHRWTFTSNEAVTVSLNYVGDSQYMYGHLFAAYLPTGTIPDYAWTEVNNDYHDF